MKRLTLGSLLIALSAAVLLVSDWNQRKAAPGSASDTASKKWKVHFVQLNNVLDVEETEAGVRQGLKEAGLVEGRDYEVKVGNAQGDMATVNGLIDAALADGADLLVTFSTPTLQVALQRARRVPIVFTYIASAVLAGAGRSREDHLPNVTGVDMIGAYGEMITLLKEHFPAIRRIGTLFVPAEVNMVYNKDRLGEEAAKAGLELVSAPVTSSTDVPDAALALAARRVDAFCQIAGNLTAASFAGIAQAARRARIPVFAYQKTQAYEGAAVVLGRDYHDAGKASGVVAARVMRGEPPASIPFQNYSRTRLILNPPAAQAVGLAIPASLLRQAAEVIGAELPRKD